MPRTPKEGRFPGASWQSRHPDNPSMWPSKTASGRNDLMISEHAVASASRLRRSPHVATTQGNGPRASENDSEALGRHGSERQLPQHANEYTEYTWGSGMMLHPNNSTEPVMRTPKTIWLSDLLIFLGQVNAFVGSGSRVASSSNTPVAGLHSCIEAHRPAGK